MKPKDLFLIIYLPFVIVGFVIGGVFKALMVGAERADIFTKWGAKR